MPSEMAGLEKAWTVLKNIYRNMPDGMIEGFMWRPQRDSNSCYRRERAMS